MKPLKRNPCLQNNKLVRYHTLVSQYHGIITAFILNKYKKKKKNLYSENQEVFPKKKKTPTRETEKRQNRKQLQRAKLGLYCCSVIHSTYTSYQWGIEDLGPPCMHSRETLANN